MFFNREERDRIVKAVRKVEGDRLVAPNIQLPFIPFAAGSVHSCTVEIVGDKDPGYGFYPGKIVFRNVEDWHPGGDQWYDLVQGDDPDCVAYVVNDDQTLDKTRRYAGKVIGYLGYSDKEAYAVVEVDPSAGQHSCTWCADVSTAVIPDGSVLSGVIDLNTEEYIVNFNGLTTAVFWRTETTIPAGSGDVWVEGSLDLQVIPGFIQSNQFTQGYPSTMPGIPVVGSGFSLSLGCGGFCAKGYLLVLDANRNYLGAMVTDRPGVQGQYCYSVFDIQSSVFPTGDVESGSGQSYPDGPKWIWRKGIEGFGHLLNIGTQDIKVVWAADCSYLNPVVGGSSKAWPAKLKARQYGAGTNIKWGTLCEKSNPCNTTTVPLPPPPPPVPPLCGLTISVAGSPASGSAVNSGTSVTVTVTPTGGQGAVTYSWYTLEQTPQTGTSSSNNWSVNLVGPGTVVIEVTATDANGCTAQGNISYTVNPVTTVTTNTTTQPGINFLNVDASGGNKTITIDPTKMTPFTTYIVTKTDSTDTAGHGVIFALAGGALYDGGSTPPATLNSHYTKVKFYSDGTNVFSA